MKKTADKEERIAGLKKEIKQLKYSIICDVFIIAACIAGVYLMLYEPGHKALYFIWGVLVADTLGNILKRHDDKG